MGNIKERNHLIDLLRGIAAINIIFIHTVFWSGTGYVPEYIRNISLFLDVPFFFFLAGWSYSYSGKWEKVIKKSIQLYFMTFIAILFSFLIGKLAGELVINKDLIEGLIKLNPIALPVARVFNSSLWFLRVFIPVSIIFSIILPNIKKKELSNQFMLLLIIFYMISYFDTKFLIFNTTFWFHSIFYSLGYLSKEIKINLKQLLLYIIPILIIIIILIVTKYDFNMQAIKFPPTPLYLIISMISVMISLYIKNFNFRFPIIEQVGNNAMYSYLMQGFSSTFIIYIAVYLDFNWIIKLSIMFFINLILALLLAYIYKKLFTKINSYIRIKGEKYEKNKKFN